MYASLLYCSLPKKITSLPKILTMFRFARKIVIPIGVILLSGTMSLGAVTDSNSQQDAKDPVLPGADVQEKTGKIIPEDITLLDEKGVRIRFSDLMNSELPVILTPVYYNCPNLCNLTLNGLLRAVNRETSFRLGKHYRIISFSINPEEKYNLAGLKKNNYLAKLEGFTEPEKHWRFMTAEAATIARLTQAIGFEYFKDKKDFVHPAVLVMLSPKGKITRYLYGVDYAETDFRLAILEAAEGKTGSFADKMILSCYSFDPVKRKYSLVAWKVMRIGSGVFGGMLVILLAFLWFREKRKHKV